jgi:hypothetical protein
MPTLSSKVASKLRLFPQLLKYGWLLFIPLALWQQNNHLKAGTAHDMPPASAHYEKAPVTSDITIRTKTEAYLLKYGPTNTMAALQEYADGNGYNCHDRAHALGKSAFTLMGNNMFALNLTQCQSGFMHGAMEGFIAKNGTANLKESLNNLCASSGNSWAIYNCYHGVGHGVLAWTNFDLPVATDYCNLMSTQEYQSDCRNGMFMENYVGTRPNIATDKGEVSEHTTKWLSSDPLFPCNAVKDAYQDDCYMFQTDVMYSLAKAGFADVATWCGQAPASHQRNCFRSMGRTVDEFYNHQDSTALAQCAQAATAANRGWCIVGLAEDKTWDAPGIANATRFCAVIQDANDRSYCNGTVMSRIQAILPAEQQVPYCQALPPEMYQACIKKSTG